ncbi:MAG: M14 family zinc carboxypeptidase [Candidatus Eisenbacteria bacterium]
MPDPVRSSRGSRPRRDGSLDRDVGSGAAVASPWDGYTSDAELPRALERLASASAGQLHLESLGTDAQGRSIPLMRAGSGRPEDPAFLVVAGLDGRHLIGTELALAVLRHLSEHPDSARTLLADRTLYVVPRVDLDGIEAWRGTPHREQAGIDGTADTDRDGLLGEDPADDLDGDGTIALVRVRDPDGGWIERPGHPDFLRPAVADKGEVGAWRILVEGRDDDGDEHWNEEEDAGVRLSRNFPTRFPWFERGSGVYQVSEAAARALVEFLAEHRNIGAVLVYGFEDNLLTPLPEGKASDPDMDRGRWNRQPLDAPIKADLPLLLELAKQYRESLGLPNGAKKVSLGSYGVAMTPEELGDIPSRTEAAQGGLAEFVYYARGRLGLATPGWSPGLQMARAKQDEGTDRKGDGDGSEGGESKDEPGANDAGAATDGKSSADATGGSGTEVVETAPAGPESHDTPGETGAGERKGPGADDESDLTDEGAFRDWLVGRDPSAWLGWKPITHPDFPDQEAFVGGYAPLARINPPIAVLDSLAPPHVALVERVLAQLPRVRLRDVRLDALGNGLYELRFTAENTGYLPDRLAQGQYSAEVRPTRFELGLPGGAAVMGGPSRGFLGRLEGSGGSEEVRRLLRLPSGGKVTVKVISELGGRDEHPIAPGEHWHRPDAKGGSR